MPKYGYKFTSRNLTTYNGTRWKLGEWKHTKGDGRLCSDQWLHGYSHPLVAAFMYPAHLMFPFKGARFFKAEVGGEHESDCGVKEGWSAMRLIEEIDLPVLSREVLIRTIIMTHKKKFGTKPLTWIMDPFTSDWLSGKDRSKGSVREWANRNAHTYKSDDFFEVVLSKNMDRARGSAARCMDTLVMPEGLLLRTIQKAIRDEEVIQRQCYAKMLESRTITVSYIPLSAVLPKELQEEEKFTCALSEDSPFSWGTNDVTLVTADRIREHITGELGESGEEPDTDAQEVFKTFVKNLKSLGSSYVDLEG